MFSRQARRATVLSILSSLFVSLHSFAAAPKDFDIAGVKIGQNAEQARQAIQAYNPTMKFEPALWPHSPAGAHEFTEIWARTEADVRAKKYASDTSSDFDEYFQVWFGQATGKAYYIVRKVGSRTKNSVTVDALQNALIAKYGEPQSRGPFMWTWAFRTDGRVAKPEDGCITSSMGQLIGPTPIGVNKVCGLALKVSFTAEYSNPTLLQVVSFGLLDHAALTHDMELMQAQAKAAAQRRDSNDANKYGGNVPKL